MQNVYWLVRISQNFDDYPGLQLMRSWANTYAQDCNLVFSHCHSCELYQPRNPQRSLEALGVHTCDRVQAGSNSDKIRLRFCRSEESATLKANSLDG